MGGGVFAFFLVYDRKGLNCWDVYLFTFWKDLQFVFPMDGRRFEIA